MERRTGKALAGLGAATARLDEAAASPGGLAGRVVGGAGGCQ